MHDGLFPGHRGAPQRLAVDGDDFARRQLGNRRHPGGKDLFQLLRVEREKTRLKVSCEGMPPGSFRKPLNHSRLQRA